MKTRIVSALGLLLFLLLVPCRAQEAAAGDPAAEINAWVARIQAKIRAGKTGAAEFAAEVAEFDVLRAKAAVQKPELAAKLLLLGYTFQLDVVKNPRAATELRKELETNHRKFLAGTAIGRDLEMQERAAKTRETQAGLIGKPAPELNFMWASRGGLTRLSALRGKVVVLDFWATWCGPCIATFPQIRELAEHYKEADVVVLGVTSLQGYVAGLTPPRIDTKDDPEREFAATAEFIKAKQMTWPVVFTEERVFNPRYSVLGIPHMAIIAPDGTVRHNGLHPGMPKVEKLQMIDQILTEFGKLKGPRSSGE